MADKNVFEILAEQLQAMPDELQAIYEDVTIDTLATYFDKFAEDLKATSGSRSLNAKMTKRPVIYEKGKYYIRRLDWDDKIIVNEDKGKSYGRDRARIRERNKRNYSVYPATYHDLAYIINYGQKGISGTYFIKRARRKLDRWENKRDNEFRKRLHGIKTK